MRRCRWQCPSDIHSIALVYYLLDSNRWLANLGRQNRSVKKAAYEDMLQAIQRLTVLHQRGEGPDGHDRYVLAQRLDVEEHD